jgi:succinyl-CoA synthetase beta subunit
VIYSKKKDRSANGPLLIGSAIGGTSIEDIAEKDPSAIIKMPIDIMNGFKLN